MGECPKFIINLVGRSSRSRQPRETWKGCGQLLFCIDSRVPLCCVGVLLARAMPFVEHVPPYINHVPAICYNIFIMMSGSATTLTSRTSLVLHSVIIAILLWDCSTNTHLILVTYMHATPPSWCMYLRLYVRLNWKKILNFTSFIKMYFVCQNHQKMCYSIFWQIFLARNVIMFFHNRAMLKRTRKPKKTKITP